MTTDQIKEKLCEYDERNPNYNKDYPKVKEECYCDNCFYGGHYLAEELLKVIAELEKEKEDFKILEKCYLGIE